ncbi:MAG: hypothetical protein SCI25_03425 [Desulfuromonadales bacterium]|nr:hypothetical protein [Desulfuromonadales bacterium]MDW7758994.1 hypothetical protein [Desulfuromonadales bacterium]
MEQTEKETAITCGRRIGEMLATGNPEKARQWQDTLLRAKAAREEDGGPQDYDYWEREGCLEGIDSVLNSAG